MHPPCSIHYPGNVPGTLRCVLTDTILNAMFDLGHSTNAHCSLMTNRFHMCVCGGVSLNAYNGMARLGRFCTNTIFSILFSVLIFICFDFSFLVLNYKISAENSISTENSISISTKSPESNHTITSPTTFTKPLPLI